MTDEQDKSPPAHTPLPWKADMSPLDQPLDNGDDPLFVYAGDDCDDTRRDIATVHSWHGREQRDANASFIVRACNHHCELIDALDRAFDLLEGIADKLLYEEGQPVTFLESREIEDIYNDAISELAPFETLIRKARSQA